MTKLKEQNNYKEKVKKKKIYIYSLIFQNLVSKKNLVFGVGFTFHRMAYILSACLTFITLYYTKKKRNFF